MEEATAAIEKLHGQDLDGKALNVALSERRGERDGNIGKGKPG